jgi:putative ABC transport system permease protein
MNIKLEQGSFFTTRDEDSRALVAVLDKGAVNKLYGNPDEQVVGERIQIGNETYDIVGVTASQSAMDLQNGNIYVPFSTCEARLTGSSSIYSFYGLAREEADMETIADETSHAIADYFNIPDDQIEESIYVYTMQSIIDELNATMGSFQLMVTAVASISLLVGGIGIMNMMLTNVTERIREIGLRKALGATRTDITLQFLLEAVCLCLVGGVIGCALGYLGALGLAQFAGSALAGELGAEGSITPVLDSTSMLTVAGICVTIGIVFGIYPAWRAAKLDPVESLHYQ